MPNLLGQYINLRLLPMHNFDIPFLVTLYNLNLDKLSHREIKQNAAFSRLLECEAHLKHCTMHLSLSNLENDQLILSEFLDVEFAQG